MHHPLFLPSEAAPAGARPLPELPLLVLVGLTGVGKSSLLEALAYPTLPDRREVVDRYVLPLFGVEGKTLDRAERFALTRRFRQTHPGGVAEALSQARTLPTWPLLFDGLRGEAEVAYALEHLPLAHFVVLEARDLTRLSRLLGRGDHFDRVKLDSADEGELRATAQGVFSAEELEQALGWGFPAQELLTKLKIVVEERKNYDPEGPRRLLEGHPRALFLDTEALSVAEEARQIEEFVGRIHAQH
ncbi:AAA family ATPase [Calidithermus timidus]|jgi:hypothetical protein|uniref:AAA family ATPase n=1 Tax=Calidithermus timidus TaxID=307124 RepID=UPI00037A94A0|nr:AAA family ATPase [Calidithermus timidus]